MENKKNYRGFRIWSLILFMGFVWIGFLISPISDNVNELMKSFGFEGIDFKVQYLSAIFIMLAAAILAKLEFFADWSKIHLPSSVTIAGMVTVCLMIAWVLAINSYAPLILMAYLCLFLKVLSTFFKRERNGDRYRQIWTGLWLFLSVIVANIVSVFPLIDGLENLFKIVDLSLNFVSIFGFVLGLYILRDIVRGCYNKEDKEIILLNSLNTLLLISFVIFKVFMKKGGFGMVSFSLALCAAINICFFLSQKPNKENKN